MARQAAESGGEGNPRDAFRAAFGAAKASHSRLDSEGADDGEEVDLTAGEDDPEPEDDDAGEEGADDDAEGDEDEEGAEGDDDAEDDGEEEGADDADDDEEEEGAEGDDDADDEDDDEKPELLTDAEIKKIQRQFPNDPKKQIKAFQAAFTKKTQALATDKKKYSAYERYFDLIDAMETRPGPTLKSLAAYYGFNLAPAKGKKGAEALDLEDDAAGEGDETIEAAAELSGKDREAAIKEIGTLLGPELEYQAEAFLNVLEKFQGKRTKAMLQAELKPLRKQNDQTINQIADKDTAVLMKRMAKRHKDWSEHEDEMLKLSQRLDPKGMEMEEYLEHLYATVTRKKWDANKDENVRREAARRTKKKLKRLGTVEPGEDRGRRSATPDTQIRRRARRNASFQDAYQAAKRGERWDAEDDD
jgi:hypothetical protein